MQPCHVHHERIPTVAPLTIPPKQAHSPEGLEDLARRKDKVSFPKNQGTKSLVLTLPLLQGSVSYPASLLVTSSLSKVLATSPLGAYKS